MEWMPKNSRQCKSGEKCHMPNCGKEAHYICGRTLEAGKKDFPCKDWVCCKWTPCGQPICPEHTFVFVNIKNIQSIKYHDRFKEPYRTHCCRYNQNDVGKPGKEGEIVQTNDVKTRC